LIFKVELKAELNSGPGKNVAVASVKYHGVPSISILAYVLSIKLAL
jgi:hypothetical protein